MTANLKFIIWKKSRSFSLTWEFINGLSWCKAISYDKTFQPRNHQFSYYWMKTFLLTRWLSHGMKKGREKKFLRDIIMKVETTMRLECGEIERKFLLSLMKTNERDVKINIVSERKENRSMTMKICLCVRFPSFFGVRGGLASSVCVIFNF